MIKQLLNKEGGMSYVNVEGPALQGQGTVCAPELGAYIIQMCSRCTEG